VTSREEYFRL